jgi:UDP-MurNAc hydroxylase
MPGGWLDVQDERHRGGPNFDADTTDLRAYLTAYQADVMGDALLPPHNGDAAAAERDLMAALQRKLDIYAEFKDRLTLRSNIYVQLDERAGYIKIDVADCRVKAVGEIGEHAHCLHRTSLARLAPVIAGEMSWEAYFLTFRFRNRRVPDEYDSGITMFLFADPESYRFGIEQLIKHRDGGERMQVTTGQGAYEINRFCPHQGGDLKYALVGETLICPRHYWRFDLADGGKCTANADTIRAEKIVDPSLRAKRSNPA